jgi:ubiquinol-cytochrome c reductase cytochrome c1 subunit
MTPPLHTEGQVAFDDGTKATVDQMSNDVVNFLQWVAEPEMQESKSLGIKVLIFLIFFTVLFYIAKKRIWKRIE